MKKYSIKKAKTNNLIPRVKILVTYHKKDELLKNEVFVPIHAGRNRAINNNNPDLDWLMDNCIGDNTGDNISDKNATYNEMTSIYWAWKNYEKIGNPNYIGHFHYRRHLCFNESEKSVMELGNINPGYIESGLGYSNEKISELCRDYDLIVPMPQYRGSAYSHFERNFDVSELDTAISILGEKYPEYKLAAQTYLNGKKLYFCNLFIMNKELFFEYCNFMFSILSAVEEKIDMSNKRMYISEWITGIFIQKQIEKGKKIKYLATAVAEANTTISVAFSTDNNYFEQMIVTLTSMLTNAKPSTFYEVYCLMAENVADGKMKYIDALKEKYENFTFNALKITEDMLPEVCIHTKHISIVSFYRLLLADLLPKVDKILYLDVDLVVCSDLTNLYRYALDNNYIGGVKAPGYYYPEKWRRNKLEELGLPFMDQYINAGVLLMNLKKIRQDEMGKMFLELMKNNYRSEDQDVLNKACYGSIKTLPFMFNVQTKYMGEDGKEKGKLSMVIPNDEILDAVKAPVIIHFANPEKPWNNKRIYGGDEWFKYAMASPCREHFMEYRANKQFVADRLRAECEELISEIENDGIFPIPDNYTNDKEEYKVSIIIPCYNVAKTINQTLTSCITQLCSGLKIEIICVDDGSSDETVIMLAQWARKYKNIKVFAQVNSGSGAARNLGLKIAKGEFIAFMDADDYYPSETTLENLYFSAVKNSVDICGGSFVTDNGGKKNYTYSFPLDGYTFTQRGVMNYRDYQYDFGYTRFIYKRRLLDNNNLIFPDYLRYQDPPFFVKAMLSAGKFMMVHDCTYVYRISHKSINWTERRICDFMSGVICNLKISSENNLPKLHYYTYLRIKPQIDIIRSWIGKGSYKTYSICMEMINAIDFELIRKADNFEANHVFASNRNEMVDLLLRDLANAEYQNCGKENMVIADSRFLKTNIEIQELQDKLNEAYYIINETHKSFSYRLGLFMTWIPRKIRDFFKNRK